MTVRFFFGLPGGSRLKCIWHHCASFIEPGAETHPSDCGEDASCQIHRLASEELIKAGLMGRKLDRMQQAEISLKVSRRVLEGGTVGR